MCAFKELQMKRVLIAAIVALLLCGCAVTFSGNLKDGTAGIGVSFDLNKEQPPEVDK